MPDLPASQMEEIEQRLFGRRDVDWLARAMPDLSISPEEARVDVAIHELAEERPEPPRSSGGHAGDDRNGLRDHPVIGERRLQAHVRGAVEAFGHGEGVRNLACLRWGERIEATAELMQAPRRDPAADLSPDLRGGVLPGQKHGGFEQGRAVQQGQEILPFHGNNLP